MKVFLYTGFALTAFAFNSVLCRLALGAGAVDAASFTFVRLVTGAISLLIISRILTSGKKTNVDAKGGRGNWISAFFLFAYAICFSFAYTDLTTGTGALILFGSVQATMICAAFAAGERPKIVDWLGLISALGGLVYLVFPGFSSPPLKSAALMTAAGAAWGFYTLRGRGTTDPLADTTGNFLRAVPMIAVAALPFIPQIHFSAKGILLAAASGAIASGIGYSVWYLALRFHTATRAAVLQLSVPALAAFGGVIFLSEKISLRLIAATILIVGGIALTVFKRGYDKNKL